MKGISPTSCMAALLLLIAHAAAHEPYPDLPKDYCRVVAEWQELTLDKDAPLGWEHGPLRMPFGGVRWHVYYEDKQLKAEVSPDQFENHPPLPPFNPIWPGHSTEESKTWVATPVDNGWVVGFDLGEWGGALVWFNSDGTESRQLSDGRVSSFLATPDGVFVEGLIPAFKRGVFKLEHGQSGHWSLRRLFEVDKPPPIYLGWLGNHTLVFFLDRKMHRYSPDNGVKPLPDNLLPARTKVAVNESRLSCGGDYALSTDKLLTTNTEGVVAETDLHTGTTRYLVPDTRFINEGLRWFVSAGVKYSPDSF